VVFCKPLAVARAVVRRDGRVQAAGHPADHARLGLAEERLDALCGSAGVIDELARSVTLTGKVKGKSRRAVTPALAIRLTLLMTLMPDADYAEVTAALLGDLAAVPWQRPYRLPTATVFSTWREAVGARPLEQLRDMVLAAIDAERRDHDYRAVTVGDLDVGSIDGSLTRVPDTPANREAFGSAGHNPQPARREQAGAVLQGLVQQHLLGLAFLPPAAGRSARRAGHHRQGGAGGGIGHAQLSQLRVGRRIVGGGTATSPARPASSACSLPAPTS
jgi:hypothetical protein